MKKKDEAKRPIIVIKKIKKVAGHHGGAWKVAYADFVTALMALFMVMWLLAAMDKETTAGVALYFRDPGIFDKTAGSIIEGRGESLLPLETLSTGKNPNFPSLFRGLAEHLEEELREMEEYPVIKDQIKIRLLPEGLMIDLMDKDKNAFFDLSSSKITPLMLHVLEKIVQEVGKLPNKVAIGGHTDSRPYRNSDFFSNWELSSARALNARRAMEELGFPGAQVDRVVGYAESLHLFPEEPLNPANRRISILVLKDKSFSPEEKNKSLSSEEEDNPLNPEEKDNSLSSEEIDNSLTSEEKDSSVSPEEEKGSHS